MLPSAQRMLHERELLQQDLSSVLGQPQGCLVIGSVPTAVPIAARFAGVHRERHRGIVSIVRSMSSAELENGLESLSLDMGLGYTDRSARYSPRLRDVPQYIEQYFLVRRAAVAQPEGVMKRGGKASAGQKQQRFHCVHCRVRFTTAACRRLRFRRLV